MIPKVIHYCWLGRNKPQIVIDCINSWYITNPDWEIIEWNEDNFDITSSQYTQFMYEHMEYSYISDYARQYVLYQYGGIYLDTDIIVHRSLNDLINNHTIVAYENPSMGTYGHFFLGSEPNHNGFRDVLEYYNVIFSKKCITEANLNSICYLHSLSNLQTTTVLPREYVTESLQTPGIYATHIGTHNWSPRRLTYQIINTSLLDPNAKFRIYDSKADKYLIPDMLTYSNHDKFIKILPNTNILISTNFIAGCTVLDDSSVEQRGSTYIITI